MCGLQLGLLYFKSSQMCLYSFKNPLFFPFTLLASIININDAWGDLSSAELSLFIGGRGEGLMSFYLHRIIFLGCGNFFILVSLKFCIELLICDGDLQ